jgi:ParB family transcriptional regulator, chromosome partitioning protein
MLLLVVFISILHQEFNAKQRGQQLNQNILIQLEKIESVSQNISEETNYAS